MSLTKFVTICCLIVSLSHAAKIIPMSDVETVFTVEQQSPTRLGGTFQSGDIIAQPMVVDEGDFFRIVLPGFHSSHKIGHPELPQLHRLIEIPQNAMPRIEVVYEETKYYNLEDFGIENPIFPYQQSLSKSQDPDDVPFEWNETIYEEDDYLSPELISVDIKGQLRSLRLANLVIRPIDYNPVSGMIKVTTNVEFIIHFDGADLAETKEIKEKYYSPYFESVYHRVANYEEPDLRDDL